MGAFHSGLQAFVHHGWGRLELHEDEPGVVLVGDVVDLAAVHLAEVGGVEDGGDSPCEKAAQDQVAGGEEATALLGGIGGLTEQRLA